ncbi:MAG TPA: CHAT domain-containing protein [Thermoanaerobaculia bacterium]|jgi:hypothetical protein
MFFYEDLDLRLYSDGDQFVVHARHGSQTATERLDLDQAIFGELLHIEGADAQMIHDRGGDLFKALIRGSVRDLYQQGRGRAMTNDRTGFRLRLIFDPRDVRVRRLIAVPWEILRDGSADASVPAACDARRPVVRTIETVEPPLPVSAGPLQRVLLALASPSGPGALTLHDECAFVENALARTGIRPRILVHATRDTLFDTIADTNPHVVHYMGHSDIDGETGDGVLLLEDRNGDEDPLPGTLFAGFFTGRHAPRLVILNSCLSARQGRGQAFAGLAFSLVAAGLPAVIAMQSKVGDESAVRFTERLYSRISDGDPIEAAVADARRALRSAKKQTTDWAAPVLFVRDSARSAPPLAEQQPQPDAEAPPAEDRTDGFHITVTNGKIGTQIIGHTNYMNHYYDRQRGDA